MNELPKDFIVFEDGKSPRKILFNENDGWELYYLALEDSWEWDDSISEETARNWFNRGKVYIPK